jgi:hypothetical protein
MIKEKYFQNHSLRGGALKSATPSMYECEVEREIEREKEWC